MNYQEALDSIRRGGSFNDLEESIEALQDAIDRLKKMNITETRIIRALDLEGKCGSCRWFNLENDWIDRWPKSKSHRGVVCRCDCPDKTWRHSCSCWKNRTEKSCGKYERRTDEGKKE